MLPPRANWLPTLLRSSFLFVVLLALWSGISALGWVNPNFFPSPLVVVLNLVDLARNEGLMSHIGWSLLRITVGFGLAVLVATPLGVWMAVNRVVFDLISPFVSFVRYLPPSAFIPICLLWLGIGLLMHISVIFLGVFFYLVGSIADEVKRVGQGYVETAVTLGASRWQVLSRVVLPAAMPGIFDSYRSMLGIGWTYIVVVEMVAARAGLGKLIYESYRFLNVSNVLGGMLIIGIIGLVLDLLLWSSAKALFPWRENVKV